MDIQINTYTYSNQNEPSISGLSDGGFVSAWTSIPSQDGSGKGVFGQVFYGNGTKLGSEFRVNTYTYSNQNTPMVTGLLNGNFAIVWLSTPSQDGSGNGVFGQVFYGNSTKLGSEFRVNTYTYSNQNEPSVSGLSDGGFVVVWTSTPSQDGSGEGVFGQVFYSNGTKLGYEFQVNTYTYSNQNTPIVTGLSNGNFAVMWRSIASQDGSGEGIFGQLFYGNGTKLGSEFQVNTYTYSNQNEASVVGLSNGNFVSAWTSIPSQDGSGKGVFGQVFYGNGTKLGSEFQVNTYTYSNQNTPKVIGLTNGIFAVLWISIPSQDGSGEGVFGQVFYGNGTKLGSEFQVNTYTYSNQNEPSVSGLRDGNFAVVWTSIPSQDSSGDGVFGQVFYPNATKIPYSQIIFAPTTLAPTPVPTSLPTPVPTTLAPTIAPETVYATPNPLTSTPITNAPTVASFADDYGIFDTIFVVAGASTLFMLEII